LTGHRPDPYLGSLDPFASPEVPMPHHKSAAKRVITNETRRRRNITFRSRMRSALKSMRSASNKTEAETAYRTATSILDRTAAKGIIKKETANRHKARLARFAAKFTA
jgi:small subunit ribosomal protein S20